MTNKPLATLQRAQKWLIRKGAENRDAIILGKLQDEIERHLDSLDLKDSVLFFNASTRLGGMSLNSAFSILTNLSLHSQGVKTVEWVCKHGMSHCILGTDRRNPQKPPPCSVCIPQSRRTFRRAEKIWFEFHPDPDLTKQLQELSFDQLSKVEFHGIPYGTIVLPSLRWILRQHHIEENKENLDLFREYILSAENISREIEKVLEEIRSQVVVVFNGQFFPEAVVHFVALRKGIRVITHEVALQPLSAFFTDGEATAYPVNIPNGFQLNSSQERSLDEYIRHRSQGDFSMAGIRFWPKMHNLGPEFLKRVEGYKQIVPIFTNVVFDTSQGHANMLFPDMFAWLDTVRLLIKKHPETFFVIRAHPDEGRPGKESQESVAHWVKKNQVDRYPNVLFVDFDEYFSSYELIEKSKFVMVYNSTIGLEASILGATVLCGGKARYTQYPTVILPKTAKEYIEKADEFLKNTKLTFPTEYQQNARKFLYFQLFRTSLSFEAFLNPDPVRNGYVHFKKFPVKLLDPLHNPLSKILYDGIIKGQPFLMENTETAIKEHV